MKTSEVNKVFEEICSYNLTPNEYFALAMILQDRPLQQRMDRGLYKKYLLINNWIDLNDKATPKVAASAMFEDLQNKDFVKNVEIYRSMWPSITLPTGKPARSNVKDLENRFKWFFLNYDYDWDIIFEATSNYIDYYAQRSYSFMRTSSYFIYKEESTKIRTSTLSEWCDKIKDGVQEDHDYHIDA